MRYVNFFLNAVLAALRPGPARKPAEPVRGNRLRFETLEPRLLFSADLAPGLFPDGPEHSDDANWQSIPTGALVRQVDTQDATVTENIAGFAPVSLAWDTVQHEILFIDAGVADPDRLIADFQHRGGAAAEIEIVMLDAHRSGVEQIGEVLSRRHGIGAVHIISHGADGVVYLGQSIVDANFLVQNENLFTGWRAALTQNADILLYGCNVAQHQDGKALIDALSRLTGADVAASDDLTGSAGRGGDWDLEFAIGSIETRAPVVPAFQQAWDGLLLTSNNEMLGNQTTSSVQSTSAENRGSQQAVAFDAAQNYVVVWTSTNQDGSGLGVYARRFDSSGAAITGEILVNSWTTNDQRSARVVSDTAGNFVVTWTSSNQDGSADGVYMRRFDGNGNALTVETRVNVTTTGSQTDSVIAMNATSGDYVIAWQGQGPGDGAGVYFRRFFADGTAKDATDRLANVIDGGTENDPAVTMDASGNFVIAWGVSNKLYFQRFNAAGSTLGGRVQVDNAFATSSGVSIASDAAGNFTVVYREQNVLPLLAGIWGKGYNADGTEKYTWFHPDIGDSTSPSIDMASDGSFVLTYEKTGDGNGVGVFAQKYNANGSANGAAFQVNQSTLGTQSMASVAVIDTNNFVVVWSGNGPGDSNGVFVRQFAPPNTAPVINSNGGGASAAVNIAENITAVTTVTATDADLPAQTLTYSLAGGADQARFTIDPVTGALSFAVAPNFEAPTDAGANNVYDVIVQVSDGSLADTQAISVTVTEVNEFPVGAISDANASANSVAENAGVGTLAGITAAAVDPDGSTNTIVYTLDNSAGGRFAIDAATGVVTVAGVLDYETSTSHSITVRATSADGSFSTALFTIAVTDVSEAAIGAISDTNASANQVAENAVAGTLVGLTATALDPDVLDVVTYSLTDDAGGRFAINATTGVVEVVGGLDAEAATSHTIVVRADSTDGSFNTQNFTINVTDVNEFGVSAISDSNATVDAVDENAAIGTPVGITASAVDTDATTNTVTYTLDNSAGGRFAIDAATGVVTVAGAIDRETAPSHAILVRATSADGSFVTRGFTITVNPLNDNIPVITSNGGGASAAVSMVENTTAVTTVAATDADLPGQTVTYSLVGGADQAWFTIDAVTGALSFVLVPDFETPVDGGANNVYEVVVEASDGSLIDTQLVSVTLNNVNEAPTITAIANQTIAENAATGALAFVVGDVETAAGSLIVTATSSNTTIVPNANLVLGGVGANRTLTVTPAANQNGGPVTITVTVDDGAIMTQTTFDLTVTAVNTAPTITVIANQTVNEDTATGALALTVGDVETAAGSLIVTATSSNTTIVPNANLVLGGVGANRTLTVTPAANQNGGPVTITVTVDDGAATTQTTFNVTVNPVNDAPLLAGANPLPDLLPATVNPGALVSSLISAMVSDVDIGDPAGVVVTFADTTNGSWEFSLDNGATWASVGSPTDAAALALAADPGVRLRFAPNAGYLGASSVGLRAWDRSAGAAGAVLDASVNGGSSAFSAASAVAGVNVLAAAPAPPSPAPSPTPSLPPLAAPVPSAVPDPQPAITPLAKISPIVPNAPDSPPVVAHSQGPGPSAPAASVEEALTGVPATEIPPEGVMLATLERGASNALVTETESTSQTGVKSAAPASVTTFFGVPTVQADATDTASLLLGAGFEPSPDGTTPVLNREDLRDALDQLRDDVKKQAAGDRSTAGAAMVFTGTLSAGYVLWLVRGGVLISSLLSSMPAWRVIDPLPVLARSRRKDEEEDDSLESMVDDAPDEETSETNPASSPESDGRIEPSVDERTWK